MRGVRAGLCSGLAIALILIACVGPGTPRTNDERMQKLNLVTNLWTQIRGWRQEAGMPLDPPRASLNAIERVTVKDIEKICPEGHQEPKACEDVCSLADAICDNADAICEIATELGDSWAREKCSSAKASCKEAKQRCCSCEEPK
jgi:hypothetical protein